MHNPNWHGHNYTLDVCRHRPGDRGAPEYVIDLAVVKRIVTQEVIDKVDHRNLNLEEVDFLRDVIPTTENFVVGIWRVLEPRSLRRDSRGSCCGRRRTATSSTTVDDAGRNRGRVRRVARHWSRDVEGARRRGVSRRHAGAQRRRPRRTGAVESADRALALACDVTDDHALRRGDLARERRVRRRTRRARQQRRVLFARRGGGHRRRRLFARRSASTSSRRFASCAPSCPRCARAARDSSRDDRLDRRPRRVSRERGIRREQVRRARVARSGARRGQRKRRAEATLVSPSAVDTSLWDPVNPKDERPGFTARRQMLRADAVASAVMFAVAQPADVNVDELRLSGA